MSFDFLTSNTMTSPQGIVLTNSRGTGATMIGADGYMTYAPENLMPRSNQFTDAAWSKGNVTINPANTFTDPQGDVLTAMFETTTFDIHQLGTGATPMQLNWGDYLTYSIKVKSIGGRHAYIGSNAAAAGTNEYCFFDLTNGTIGSIGSSVINPSITAIGDGVYRIKWSAMILNDGVNPSAFLLVTQSPTGGRAPTYAGDVTKGLYIGKAQIQRGLQATPYVETTSAFYYGSRFESNPATQVFSGQNLLATTNVFTWSRLNAPVPVAQGYVPDSIPNAGDVWRITRNSTSGSYSYLSVQSTEVNSVLELSYWVKKDNCSYFAMRFQTNYPSRADAIFNLDSGTIHAALASGEFSGVSASITPADGGYLVKVAFKANYATNFGVYLSFNNNGVQVDLVDTKADSAGFVTAPMVTKPMQSYAFTPTSGTRALGTSSASPLGLLIEEPRTNSLRYSNNLTNVVWIKNDITLTTGTFDTLSPWGWYNATKVTAGTAGTSALFQEYNLNLNDVLISSRIMKRGNTDWVRFNTANTTTTNTVVTWFNLATGVPWTSTQFGWFTLLGRGMIPLGNGWYHCWQAVQTSQDTTARFYTFETPADGSTARVSNGVYYTSGAQVDRLFTTSYNASSGRALSYIPTGSASVTRNGDQITTSLGSWFNQNEGTILQTVRTLYTNTNSLSRSLSLWFYNTSESSVHHLFAITNSWFCATATNNAGINQANFDNPALVPYVPSTIKYSYKTNDFAWCVNNGTVATDTLGSVPTDLNILKVWSRNAGNYLNWHCSKIKYFKKKIPNYKLPSLT